MQVRRLASLVALGIAGAVALMAAAEPARRARADPQALPHLEIDADPTNGTRPCSPIDATRALAAISGTYTVAICVDDNGASGPSGFNARVIWSGGVASAIEVPDVFPALDDNPDFNQAPGQSGNGSSGWDCSGNAFSYPAGDKPGSAETDAWIVCVHENNTTPGELTVSPGLLATITMQASGAGTEAFAFSVDGNSDVAYQQPSQVDLICGYDMSCPGASVRQSVNDPDGDGIDDAMDNCPSVANPGQQNSDREIDNGPGIAAKDVTVPNAVADAEGDACETDGDIDNDGLPDAQDTEPLTGAGLCGTLTNSDGHPNPAGGDITNDDNGNGTPAPADAADNGPSWDSDNDGVLDGVECQLLTNPRSAASKPSAATCGGATTDADLDGLSASAERCKWGTSDANPDSDGDGKKDCVEANDTDGNGVQNFPGDTINSAKAANNVIGKTMDFDLSGDGVVNFPGDTILSAKMTNHVGGICM